MRQLTENEAKEFRKLRKWENWDPAMICYFEIHQEVRCIPNEVVKKAFMDVIGADLLDFVNRTVRIDELIAKAEGPIYDPWVKKVLSEDGESLDTLHRISRENPDLSFIVEELFTGDPEAGYRVKIQTRFRVNGEYLMVVVAVHPFHIHHVQYEAAMGWDIALEKGLRKLRKHVGGDLPYMVNAD